MNSRWSRLLLPRGGRTMSWKIAAPLAALLLGTALIVWAAEGAPEERPDSGYVISQTEECQVGLASDPDANRPTETWTTQDPDTLECEEWGVGIQLWYDRDRPDLPPASTQQGTDYRWIAAFFVALGLVFLWCGARDIVERRHAGQTLERRTTRAPLAEQRARAERLRARHEQIASDPGSSRLARWGSRPTSGRDKLVMSAIGLLVVAGFVGGIALLDGDTEETLTQLNDRYAEHIEFTGVKRGSNSYDTIVVINGTSRPDCAEDDGWLTCSEDPQPTRE